MTNVLGLDLSLTATGLAAPDGRTYTAGGDADLGDRRLCIILDTLHGIVAHHIEHQGSIHLAVLEDLPVHGKGAGLTGMIQGVVRRYLLMTSIPYALMPAATLKAYATGSGRADKHAMRMAAYKRGAREFVDDNQCDAWWLRDAGRRHLGAEDFPLPAAQCDRLKKVKWPNLASTLDRLENL